MLVVIQPVAPIARPIVVEQEAHTFGFVVFPGSNVDVAIHVDQSAKEVCFVSVPVALVEAAIWPDLDSTALSNSGADKPFTEVPCSIVKLDRQSGLSGAKFQQSFFAFAQVGERTLPRKNLFDEFPVNFVQLSWTCLFVNSQSVQLG